MFDSFVTFASIVFFGLLTYAFQLRKRKYIKYPISCDVTYFASNEKNILD